MPWSLPLSTLETSFLLNLNLHRGDLISWIALWGNLISIIAINVSIWDPAITHMVSHHCSKILTIKSSLFQHSGSATVKMFWRKVRIEGSTRYALLWEDYNLCQNTLLGCFSQSITTAVSSTSTVGTIINALFGMRQKFMDIKALSYFNFLA